MKIKKTYQGAILNNKIVNTHSTSKTDTYSCDYINDIKAGENVYSTEEQVIGKWIDGKPLYRKGFTGNLPDSSTLFITDTGDIEKVISSKGYVNTLEGINVEFGKGTYHTRPEELTRVVVASNNLAINSNPTYYANCAFEISVEYTKTTDTGEV